MQCTSSWGCSLCVAESDGTNRSTCTIFLFPTFFLGSPYTSRLSHSCGAYGLQNAFSVAIHLLTNLAQPGEPPPLFSMVPLAPSLSSL